MPVGAPLIYSWNMCVVTGTMVRVTLALFLSWCDSDNHPFLSVLCPGFKLFLSLCLCSLQSRSSRTSVRSTAGSRGGGSWKGPSTNLRPVAPVTPPTPVPPSTLPAPHQVREFTVGRTNTDEQLIVHSYFCCLSVSVYRLLLRSVLQDSNSLTALFCLG